MKKTICLLLAVLLMLAVFSACGKEEPSKPAATDAKPGTEAGTEKPDTKPATEAPDTTEEPVVTTTEAPEPAQPAEPPELAKFPTRWTLTEIGKADNSNRDLYFYRNSVFRYQKDADGNEFLIATDHMGKPISEEHYGNISVVIPGVYAVTALSEDINSTGILLESGEQLLPCEAAIINPIAESYNSDRYSDRYVYVIYGTEVTQNKDEAFFYSTSAMISITPDDDDVLYKGYGMVFDLQEKRFVPDLKITNSSMSAVKVGGSLICYNHEDYSASIYNADGGLVCEGNGIELGNDFVVVDYKTVQDAEGKTLFESEIGLSILKGSGNYLNASDYSASTVKLLDRNGGLLFETDGAYSIFEECGGLFPARKDNSGYLLDAAGNEVASLDDCYSPDYAGEGIWEFTPNESSAPSVYYLANGKTVTAAQRYASHLINEVKNETSGVSTFRFWNAPETDVEFKCSYTGSLGEALLYVHDKPCSLVDCYSGETLLTADGFELVEDKYLFAQNGSEYTVYELKPEY